MKITRTANGNAKLALSWIEWAKIAVNAGWAGPVKNIRKSQAELAPEIETNQEIQLWQIFADRISYAFKEYKQIEDELSSFQEKSKSMYQSGKIEPIDIGTVMGLVGKSQFASGKTEEFKNHLQNGDLRSALESVRNEYSAALEDILVKTGAVANEAVAMDVITNLWVLWEYGNPPSPEMIAKTLATKT